MQFNGDSSLKDKIVSCWEFDDVSTANGQTVLDSVGNINGTYYNSPLQITGKLGYGYHQGNYTSYVTIPNDVRLTPTSAFSVSMWCNMANWSEPSVFVSKRTPVTGIGEYDIQIESNNVRIYIGDGVTNFTKYLLVGIPVSSLGLIGSAWTHFAFTWNGIDQNGFKLYVNGVLYTFTSLQNVGGWTSCVNTPTPLTIGMSPFNEGYMNNIDQAAIWNRELTQSNVTELYNGGNGKFYTSFSGLNNNTWTHMTDSGSPLRIGLNVSGYGGLRGYVRHVHLDNICQTPTKMLAYHNEG